MSAPSSPSLPSTSSGSAASSLSPTASASSPGTQSLSGVQSVNAFGRVLSTIVQTLPLISKKNSDLAAGALAAGGSMNANNPYPFRTMIGNLYYYIRQHRKPIILVPSMLRLIYQYRRPLMSAVQSLSKGADVGGGALSAAESIAAPAFSLPGALSDSASAASSNVAMYMPPPPGAFGNLLPGFSTMAAGQPAHSALSPSMIPKFV